MNIGRWFRSVGYLFRRNRFEGELEEEMRLHRELRAAKLREAGEPDAEMAARRRFGNQFLLREQSRDQWGWRFLETLSQDMRYALRQFRKNRGFTVVAVLTLAVGIGANTGVFTVVNGVLLRPLAYPDADRLVSVNETSRDFPIMAFSYPDFQDLRDRNHSFEGVAAWREESGNLTAPGKAQSIEIRQVSARFLEVLGIHPLHGREFRPEEDVQGGPPVAMIGYELWQQLFGGRGDAIGLTLTLNGKLHTIVGILPAGFRAFTGPQLLTPIGQSEFPFLLRREFHAGVRVWARLKPGVTVVQANDDIAAVAHGIAELYPKQNLGTSMALVPLKERVVGDTTSTLLILAGAVGLVLLIACTNVANLLLARSVSRTHEFAVRSALGAGRGRVIRQLLTESVLLSLLGGLGGLAIAVFGTGWAVARLSAQLPRTEEIVPDARVFGFALAVSLLTGMIFGLVPALRQRAQANEALGQSQRGTARGMRRLQDGLVIGEVALTLVLLMGAGLMLRTIDRLWSVNPGFDPNHVVRMGVALSPSVMKDPARVRVAWERVLEEVRNAPGVEAAAASMNLPLSGDDDALPYWTSPEPPPPNKMPIAEMYVPSPGYFETLKIPLLKGRSFTAQDRLGSEPVIVIDERMAKTAFADRDAVGQRMNFMGLNAAKVIGVVGRVKRGLDESENAKGAVYFPLLQLEDGYMQAVATGATLLVRTSGSPLAIMPALRRSVLGPGQDQPIRNPQTLEAMIGESLTRRRLLLMVLAAFAGVALLLASIGIYGMISYSVNQRVREMGIRLALGAEPADVRGMVVKQGMTTVLVGIALGAAASLGLARLLGGILYGVGSRDPLTLLAVIAVMIAVALAASLIPARRASRVDPLVALRYE
jgi:putative ABC transport system permease protein